MSCGSAGATGPGRVREWELGFHEFIRTRKPEIVNAIKTTKTIGKDDVEAPLVKAIAIPSPASEATTAAWSPTR